ncbi:MAG: ATP-binding protein [Stackebrandtia sp.]
MGTILPRHAREVVTEAMSDTRVVLVNGARQGGKSTLVQQIGNDIGAKWFSLDDPDTLRLALENPSDFVEVDRPLIIDEIQRAPELVLPIKYSVDQYPRPGKFLLTGSARVLGLRNLPDSLVGRMETVELWPLSQGEIDGRPDRFVDAIFRQGTEFRHTSAESRTDYIDRLVRGGFPESVARSQKRRVRFFSTYVGDLINRDVRQLMSIERGREMRQLVELLAAVSGQLLVEAQLAKKLGIDRKTVETYVALLEEVFLIKRIPAWTRNLATRATATPKVAMVDSGVAASLIGANAHRLRQPGAPLGHLLEGFVAMELARQLTWSEELTDIYHYRTRDKVEVDIVLENRRGEAVGIEVKAAQVVKPEDFKGLRNLVSHVGDDFIAGVLLYAGKYTLTIDEKLLAVPISALWESGPVDS